MTRKLVAHNFWIFLIMIVNRKIISNPYIIISILNVKYAVDNISFSRILLYPKISNVYISIFRYIYFITAIIPYSCTMPIKNSTAGIT